MKTIISFLIISIGMFLAVAYKTEITNFFMSEEKEILKNPVATLLEKENNVKYKRSTKLIWEKTKERMRFALMDSISTEEKARAVITFDTGAMLNISEDSLVVIDYPELDTEYDVTQLKLEDGILQIRNTKENNITIVKTGDLTTTTKGIASVGFKVKNKKAEIWVDEGVAVVSDKNGKEIIINQSEYKQFATDQVFKEEITTPQVKRIKKQRRFLNVKIKTKKKLTTGRVRSIITRQRNKIDRCYQKRGILRAKGIIALRITIQNTGRVSNVNITKSTLNNAIVDRCVKLWIKATKFPSFEDKPKMEESIRFVFN